MLYSEYEQFVQVLANKAKVSVADSKHVVWKWVKEYAGGSKISSFRCFGAERAEALQFSEF